MKCNLAMNNLNPRTTMKRSHPLKLRLRAWLSLAALAAAICVVSGVLVACADPQSTNTAAAGANKETKDTKEKQMAKKLTGADLYAINCSRCHAERYPTEFTPSQWKTVLTHMRVRANLPAPQAREVLKYLQEESSN